MRKTLKYGTPLLLAAGVVYLLGDSECSEKEDAQSTSAPPPVARLEESVSPQEETSEIQMESRAENPVPNDGIGSLPTPEEHNISPRLEMVVGEEAQREADSPSFIDSYVEACGGDEGLALQCIILAESNTIPPALIEELQVIVSRSGSGWARREIFFGGRDAVLELLHSWEHFGDFSASFVYQLLQESRAALSLGIDAIPGYDFLTILPPDRFLSLINLISLPSEEIMPELLVDLEEIAQIEIHYPFISGLAQSLLFGYEKYGNFSTSDPPCEICPEDDVWHGRFFDMYEMLFSLPRASEGPLSEEGEALIAETVQYVQDRVNHDANPFIGQVFNNVVAPVGLHSFYQFFDNDLVLPQRSPSQLRELFYPQCPPF